jgi:enediyne biosynthesis protein E4
MLPVIKVRSKKISAQFIKPVFIVLLLLGIFFNGCNNPKNVFQWHNANGFRWADLAPLSGQKVGFKKQSASLTGIDFVNNLDKEDIIDNRHLFDGSGVALGDIDNDGFCDIYFCRLKGSNVLYKNKGNWEFEDITDEAGVAYQDYFSKGAVFADLDGDSDLDLIVTVLNGPNACFINDGHGKFREATDASGFASLTHRTGNTSMALGDVDGDGDLDLYMACYKAKSHKDTDQVQFNTKGQILNRQDYGEPDILYLNDGQGHFKNVRLKSEHFLREDGRPLPMPRAWGLAARMQDMDNDGDPDIYVCNDFLSPDFIWINDGLGDFKEVDNLAIRSTSLSSMAVDFSDIDRDGDMDFFVAEMMSRQHKRRMMQMSYMQGVDFNKSRIYTRPQVTRNTLFLNRGDGTYAEIANFSGLQASDWTWSAIFMDIDLDGYEDLLTTTGHAYDVQDTDTGMRIMQSHIKNMSELRNTIFEYPRLETPNFAFRNNGDLTFTEVGEQWGFNTKGISHGMAYADLDNDGDLDVVVNNYQSAAGLYKNESTEKRVAVRLKGLSPNTQGIGAKVTLLGGPVVQSKEVISGGQYLSGSDAIVVFATKNSGSMKLQVIWRNGKRSVIDSVKSNRIYEIHEDVSEDFAPAAVDSQDTYFKDVSDLVSHYHHERPFDDYYFQPLLPNRLSKLGPGVSWYDVDQDQDDDLFISSGRDGKPALFINDSRGRVDKFHELELELTAAQDQSTALFFNTANKTTLLIGNSNYENTPAAAAVSQYSVSNSQLKLSAEFPPEIASTGPLSLADYDNDGDLDLFVGGRVIPGQYPAPASSKLYLNINGHFQPDVVNSKILEKIGLVCASVFSDIDNDGDPDLILALEWGPLRIFKNEKGNFNDVTDQLGFADKSGWWNGVATGDFDEDGQMDIVATNWGLNSKYNFEKDYPLKVYYDDFDNNGRMDIIEAHYDPVIKDMVPERDFSTLSLAMSFIKSRISSFEQFGSSNLKQIIGDGLLHADSLSAKTLAHTVFLNRGKRFEAVELPSEAQFSAAFSCAVADFDGDGHDDIFLSQNFFSSQPQTPRIDAGRGLWLKGDGTGNFRAVPGKESGIKVYGEQRAAALADFNKDGRIDIVISQNAGQTKLYKNISAKPGLRVRLMGNSDNPAGIGAIVQLEYREGKGPAREIHAGAGYWSQDSPVLVLGMTGQPDKIKVQWPGGKITETKIPVNAGEVTVNFTGKLMHYIK